jgi:hypothetical protein
MITLVCQALRRAVEGAKTAVVALFFIEHRPGDPPAPGIQAEQPLPPVGPGTFAGVYKFLLVYHEYLHYSDIKFLTKASKPHIIFKIKSAQKWVIGSCGERHIVKLYTPSIKIRNRAWMIIR